MSARKRSLERANNSNALKKVKELENETSSVLGFSNCPHEILLTIFKYMNIREVCQMARVCKRWKKAAYDEVLWYDLNLGDSYISLNRLRKFMRHRCFPNAQSIRLCGNMDKHPISKTHQSVSSSLLSTLNEKCPRLSILSISLADLSSIKCTDISSDITELHFIRCEIPVKWFQNNHFTHLKRLDLDYSSRADHTHIRDCLGQKKLSETLESLSLKGCYRVEDRTVELLPQLIALTELNLDETSITQFGLQIICKELSSTLNRLSLRRCSKLKLDDKTLQFVKDSFCDNLDFKFIH